MLSPPSSEIDVGSNFNVTVGCRFVGSVIVSVCDAGAASPVGPDVTAADTVNYLAVAPMSLSLRRDRHRPRARRLTRAKSPGTAGGRGRVAAKRIGLLENLDRTPAQRHPMLAPALHARAGDNPDGGVAIDLAPGREPHVGGEPRSAPKTRRRASCRPTPREARMMSTARPTSA